VADPIPLHEPVFGGNEWQYVKECLDSGWVSSAGAYVEQFEDSIKEYTGAKYAVACVNGSAALNVALRVAGVEKDHEVIVPSLTFIAPVNAIHYCGAHPIFMAADEFFNIDIEKTEEFLEHQTEQREGGCWNKKSGRKITAILPVHVFGNAVRMNSLLSLAEANNLMVIEDAAESVGTLYSEGGLQGRHTGTIGKMGCLSFNGNKIITAGGGGMILTNDEELSEKAKYLIGQAKDDPLRYVHNAIGYNYRPSNIQAALGLAQLEQLPIQLNQKRNVFEAYRKALVGIDGLRLAPVPAYADNNHWLNVVCIDREVYGEDRDSLMKRLSSLGIQSRPIWMLNHWQKPYQSCESFITAGTEKTWGDSLCLPSSAKLEKKQIDMVTNALRRRSIFE